MLEISGHIPVYAVLLMDIHKLLMKGLANLLYSYDKWWCMGIIQSRLQTSFLAVK